MTLEARTILISGAASGIGRAIALRFAAAGARLALLDVNGDALAELAQALPGSLALRCDVADHDAVARTIGRATETLGGLDGVVNAAGVDLIRDFASMTPAEWHRVIAINLTGTMSVCHAAVDALARNPGATIVNLASGAGLQPLTHRTAYCASKAGLIMFSKALALELAPRNIRVNVVCPGAIDTPMLRAGFEAADDPSGMQEMVRTRAALQRIGQPDDIASAALFLTSTASAFATGSTLVVDGGRVFH